MKAGHGRVGVGRAHGKIILLGEHAVVYGAPALAAPVPQLAVTATARRSPSADDAPDVVVGFTLQEPGAGAARAGNGMHRLAAAFRAMTGVDDRCLVEVAIDCPVPRGRGLGSSAACARAAVLALADLFDRRLKPRAVFDLVQAAENLAHGRASGVDAAATGATSVIVFQAGSGLAVPVRCGDAASGECGSLLVIADSGVAGSTKDAVDKVRRGFERDPAAKTEFVRRVSELTRAAVQDFTGCRWDDLGGRLTDNHRLLHGIGISTGRIDTMVEVALAAGALGAKISGGGLGGCVVALAADPRAAAAVAGALRGAGAVQIWQVPVGRSAGHAV